MVASCLCCPVALRGKIPKMLATTVAEAVGLALAHTPLISKGRMQVLLQ